MKFLVALIWLFCLISLVKSASVEVTVVDKNVSSDAIAVASIITVPCKSGYISVNGVCVEVADDD